jgi:hypothetical protein
MIIEATTEIELTAEQLAEEERLSHKVNQMWDCAAEPL